MFAPITPRPAVEERGSLGLLRDRLGRADNQEDGEKGEEERSEDLRTLAIDFDGQGDRYKNWREVTREVHAPEFGDWPLEGPRSTVHLCKHAERHGRSPTGFLEKWARSKKVEETDRVFYELKTLMDILETGGSYDQLNLGALACMEVCSRRAQTIFDAYEVNPSKPNFESARYFSGQGSISDAVSPELRSFVARRARDDAEVEKQRQKVRELRRPPAAGGKKGE